MAIHSAFVPGIRYGTQREEFRVDGDPWTSYWTRGAAEKREAELAAAKPKTG